MNKLNTKKQSVDGINLKIFKISNFIMTQKIISAAATWMIFRKK